MSKVTSKSRAIVVFHVSSDAQSACSPVLTSFPVAAWSWSTCSVLWHHLTSQPCSLCAASGLSTQAKAIIFAHISTARLFPFLVFHLIKLVTTHGGLAAAAAAQLPWIYMNLFSVERSRGNLFSCWPC